MLKQLGIKAKLLVAFSSIAFVSVIVGVVSYHYSSRVVSTYQAIATDNLPNLIVFIDMKAALSEMVIPVASLVGGPSTPEEAAKAKAQLETAIGNFEKAAKTYEASTFAPGEESIWLEFKNDHFKHFVELSNQLISLSGTGNKADQSMRDKIWDGEFAQRTAARKAAFLKLSKFQLDDSAEREKEGDQLNKQMNTVIFSIVALGFGLAMLIGYLIATFLSRELASVADALATGANEVNSAVTQLSSASEELSTASSQQAASVQETATAVEEINAMVQKNAQSASESADVSAQAKTQAEQGKQAVNRMVRSMDEIQKSNQDIQSQTEEGNKKVSEIVQVIQEIGTKTKVINDIVFQTKLLSFNASVEAARAGEHGKGFAVVAEEVGNLAQMSGNSAKEIAMLLEESIRKVEAVVTESKQSVERLMQQSRTNVEHGGKTAQECGQSLEEIVSNVQRLSEMVGGIASASQEQSRGVGEISKAVQEIDHATQSNASAAQQTAASANQLSSQIAALQSASERLRKLVEGEKDRAFSTSSAITTLAPKNKVASVIPLPKKAAPQQKPSAPMKMASGTNTIPRDHDSRFEDV